MAAPQRGAGRLGCQARLGAGRPDLRVADGGIVLLLCRLPPQRPRFTGLLVEGVVVLEQLVGHLHVALDHRPRQLAEVLGNRIGALLLVLRRGVDGAGIVAARVDLRRPVAVDDAVLLVHRTGRGLGREHLRLDHLRVGDDVRPRAHPRRPELGERRVELVLRRLAARPPVLARLVVGGRALEGQVRLLDVALPHRRDRLADRFHGAVRALEVILGVGDAARIVPAQGITGRGQR